ncbi:MAG TPA: hypothetical protein DD435_13245 [Cyanobacteria bacterium UBA8530]|nr:hypothetical protein [Cyanobacteria bacterium UBA8530]
MQRKAILALGLAVALGVSLQGTAATAQEPMITSEPAEVATTIEMPGPTQYKSVPRADVLGAGVNLFSTNLLLGASPGLIGGRAPGVNFGVTANALDLRADMGLSPNFELGTGLSYMSTTPWMGQLNMTGKWALIQNQPLSISGLGGVALTADPNGLVNIGLVVGAPLTSAFMIGSNPLVLTVAPQYNIGWNSGNLSAQIPAGLVANLGFGLGTSLGITDNLFFIADSNLGFPTAGLISDSALGVRYAFSPLITADLFLGVKTMPTSFVTRGASNTVSSLGLGTSWRF